MTTPADYSGRAAPVIHFVVVICSGEDAAPLAHAVLREPGPWQLSLLATTPASMDALDAFTAAIDDDRLEVVGGDAAAALRRLLATSTAEYVAVLDIADRPGGGGVAVWLDAVTQHRRADVIVGDEVHGATDGSDRRRVFVSLPDRFSTLSRPISSGPYAVRLEALRVHASPSLGDVQLLWADTVRRVVAAGVTVRDAEIFLERTGVRPRPAPTHTARWIHDLAPDTGIDAVVTPSGSSGPAVRLVGPGARARTVSVVIPTVGAADPTPGSCGVYVTELLASLLTARHEELLEVIVVVDELTPPEVRATLDTMAASTAATSDVAPVRLVEDPATRFDFSRKVNLGAAHAAGPTLLLLNDDIEPLAPDWLGAMCDLLRINGVGVVGATLLYENDTVQHAGVVAVEGLAGHFGQGRPLASPFADAMWLADRAALAVTGACLMTTSDLWESIGGFSPAYPVNYNDLDFCLKARQAGADVVVSASAVLRHFESRSRVPVVDVAEYRVVASRWYDVLFVDPYHPGGAEVVAIPDGEEAAWPSKA